MSRKLVVAGAVAGAAAASAAAVVSVIAPAHPLPADQIARHVAIGVAWIAAGLVALWLRPSNRTGLLMTAVGFLWFVGDLGWWHSSFPYTVVLLFSDLYLAVGAHLLVAFPTGRLSFRLERAVVAVAYVDALVVANLGDFTDARATNCGGCRNLAFVGQSQPLTHVADSTSTVLQAIVAAGIVGLLVLRWRRSTPPARRVLAPVLWTGAAVAALQVALAVQPGPDEGTVLGNVAGLAFTALPLAFLIGLVSMRLHRSAIARLVIELGATRAPSEVREPLARALGDPSLEISYWLPEEQRYVDASGKTVALSSYDESRTVTLLTHGDDPVAALLHDPSLLEDAVFLDAVSAATQLALENAGLQAELRAQLGELHGSRARILAAGDEERRRLERDLHDGAQQRLLTTRLALQLVRERAAPKDTELAALITEADTELQSALEEIRALARGLHPAILTDDGLDAALAALARRSPIPVEITGTPTERLPVAVETAVYFLAAEAITNAAKHALASRVRVDVQRRDGRALIVVDDDGVGGANATAGGGLSGLRDRIEALGGHLALTSQRGAGTELRAEIPCA
jgi:signal transduction histidine kinase